MHKHSKIFFLVTVLTVFLASFFIFRPTLATDTSDIVETTFFGNLKDDGEGCGVYTILNIVVDTLSIGVGILAIIGIVIVGIRYLTAKGDIAQTKKAKQRMLQIVIGLVVYALFYAGVQWLLPGGKLNTTSCTTISDQELANLKEKERQEKAEQQKKTNPSSTSSATKTETKTSANSNDQIKNTDLKGATAVGKKVLRFAEDTAKYMDKHKFIYFQYDPSNGFNNRKIRKGYGPKDGNIYADIWPRNWEVAKQWRFTHCSGFVTLVLKRAGLLSNGNVYISGGKLGFNKSKQELLKKFTIIHGNGDTIANLVKKKKLSPGDVFGYPGATHTMIFAGKVNGKYWVYEVNAPVNQILKYNGGLHKSISGSKRVGDILHAK